MAEMLKEIKDSLPWQVRVTYGCYGTEWEIIAKNHWPIVSIYDQALAFNLSIEDEERGGKCAEGVARLFLAAPEMYEALEWIIYVASGVSKGGGVPSEQEYIDAMDAGKAALAKARGEA